MRNERARDQKIARKAAATTFRAFRGNRKSYRAVPTDRGYGEAGQRSVAIRRIRAAKKHSPFSAQNLHLGSHALCVLPIKLSGQTIFSIFDTSFLATFYHVRWEGTSQ